MDLKFKIISWLIGILMTLTISFGTYLFNSSVQAKTDIAILKNTDVSYLDILKDIKADLKDIKADIKIIAIRR